ncbi:GntR family transcriptional regulator [Fervidicella metallireducens AeB]|uniref:GntR family transcriptional regulator n=1 Tax=Fervidicella metallireducens AeB TaxID=1403537 RepID=A0A017RXT5_9CLOT|nr:S1-like domain-containing RNA-binding protein [Fervidicella metallireducens]EYE89401.1 GntR family transcriptional regulator [Fervidicella metallireducens AeB]
MHKLGDFNELEVVKEVDFGVYLKFNEEEILMPKKYVKEGTKAGDVVRVFVYRDSEDRLIATTLSPKAKVGEFAYLTVKDVNKVGAFLDWGLDKDLLVPHNRQKVKMEKGKSYVVRVLIDEATDRIIATSKINNYLETQADDEIKEGDEVDLLVYKVVELGAGVIINNKYAGIIYNSDIYKPIKTGDKLKGYISKIREDKKIDVTIRSFGFKKVLDSKDIILNKLIENHGFLALTDKSSPEIIESELQMSKKSFKKAIGMLYKEKKIEILDNGIRLT